MKGHTVPHLGAGAPSGSGHAFFLAQDWETADFAGGISTESVARQLSLR